MDFRILGRLEVLEGDRAVTLAGSKQRALLALLVLHANETLSAGRLIDELWGEFPPATAAKTLQAHVSRLRRALERSPENGGAGVVLTREGGYELSASAESVDACRFESLVIEGRRELLARRPESAAVALEAALSMWRGRPLLEFAGQHFAQVEIARLEDLRVAALEELIDANLALGRHAEVVGALEPLIAEQPYRERLRAQLMLALYRCDRQAEALQAYQDARRKLVEELGIEPGERLRELERAILAQDPALAFRLGRRIEGQAEPVQPPAAFVGRDVELAQLVGGLDDAFAGRGRLFLIVGEPGIGKSRLAEELIARARVRGALVLVGRCWEGGGAPAYWPWVQSLRAYARDCDAASLRGQLAAGAADLAQLVPELRERFPDLPQPPSSESDGARFRLFDAAVEFLRKASEERPIVLVLDDLHAADASSLLLLRFLARELGSIRILLLGAYRSVDPLPGAPLTEMLAEVAREPVTRRVSLTGLSKPQIAQYVALTASEIASPELVARLHEQTDGNPLFVGETVRLLSLEGVPPRQAGAGRLAVPQSIRDVITRRLAHLSNECNHILVLASALGREFTLETLTHLAETSEDELLDSLDEAMEARVVAEVPAAGDRLRFAHVLMRDTLYEGLSPARRIRLHKMAVTTLEALYGEDSGPHLTELAHHAIAGRDLEKGLSYAWRAADRALAMLAYEEAERLYRTALAVLERAPRPDNATRCELVLSLGEALARAGNSPEAHNVFLEAAELARHLGLSRELARAAAGYGGRIVWERVANDEQLVPLLEEGLAALGEQDLELRVRLLARLGGALRDELSVARRDAVSREAVELARSIGNLPALAYALDGRGAAIAAPNTGAEHRAVGRELRDVAEQIGDRERVVSGHYHGFVEKINRGDVKHAEADLLAATRIAVELRQPAQLWQVRSAWAMLALAAGRLSEAEQLIPDVLALGERAQPGNAAPAYAMHCYTLREFQGRLEEVESMVGNAAAEYPARPVFRCLLAHLHVHRAHISEAQRVFDDLARDQFSDLPFDMEWLYGISLLAETCSSLHDTESATVLYGLLAPYAAFNVVDTPEGIRGSVSRYLGLLATTLERWNAAGKHYDDASAMNASMGARPWQAHTQADHARMLLSRNAPGDREQAQALLDTALATYRELNLNSYVASTSARAHKLAYA